MKRIISLMLVFLFLMGCVSCKKKEEPSTPTLEVTYESTEQGSVLPDKNWENRDLKVFINQNELVGNIIENSNLADAVGYEVYSRNMYLSEKYNFNILCTEMSTAECPAQKVVNEAAMGESSYDLILDSVTDMKGALAQFVFIARGICRGDVRQRRCAEHLCDGSDKLHQRKRDGEASPQRRMEGDLAAV